MLAYYLSMQTQIDELSSDKHTQMVFVEFIEALARVAEKASLVSLNSKEFVDYTYDERFELPLHI